MDSDLENRWIVRGRFEVHVGRRLVRHRGCLFRIVDEPACALWVETEGPLPSLDDLPLMQSHAWAVFYLTEKMVEQLYRMRRQREGR
jgi:hypothetical protein